VKSLAHETALLTQEIGVIIGATRQVSADAVSRVTHMQKEITGIERVAGLIAGAVAEHQEATRRIAGNVQTTVETGRQLSGLVEQLTMGMMENLERSGEVHLAATQLLDQSSEMNAALRRAIVRAIWGTLPEADRRRAPRFPVPAHVQSALGCNLTIDGAAQDFTLIDLADFGCKIGIAGALPSATRASLAIAATGQTLDCEVVAGWAVADGCQLGLRFTDGQVDAAALLSIRQAA